MSYNRIGKPCPSCFYCFLAQYHDAYHIPSRLSSLLHLLLLLLPLNHTSPSPAYLSAPDLSFLSPRRPFTSYSPSKPLRPSSPAQAQSSAVRDGVDFVAQGAPPTHTFSLSSPSSLIDPALPVLAPGRHARKLSLTPPFSPSRRRLLRPPHGRSSTSDALAGPPAPAWIPAGGQPLQPATAPAEPRNPHGSWEVQSWRLPSYADGGKSCDEIAGSYVPGPRAETPLLQHSMENLSGYDSHGGDYGVNPEQHHAAYYNQPNEPNQHAPHQQYDQGYDHDGRPLLQHYDSYIYGAYQDNPQQQPQQQQQGGGIKRWKTVLQVLLYRVNLVLDCPVPPRLLNQLPHGERDEFTDMRYTAATCDPSVFYSASFTLRQKLFSKPRHTELFIVVTMYNEDEILFARTMIGVFKNVEYMCKRNESKTWGKDAWKKIVVCVVSDGRSKINARTRALLAGMGVYQEGIAKQQVNGKDVTSHIYEYTTQVGMQIKSNIVQLIPQQQPVQMLFCLKEKNQKKINSHRWFFSAFGRVLDPNICVLIDAGTKPGGNSIYHLWKAFDLEPMCAGACGEIKAMLGTNGKNLINPLVAAQNFEYKMSDILDKPLESAFGFISVQPGAFSADRYVALQNDKNGQGPLEKYFAGEKMLGAGAGSFTANMYLAEDRILCFELVTKRNCHWILQYVKSATGETDVPDDISELILQRRRWLNGSFFAAIYAIAHFYQFFRSDHSVFRKLAFFIEFTFNTINMIFAWFAIGNFFLVFKILTSSLASDDLLGTTGNILSVVFEWLYGISLITCFVLSMGNRPAGSGKFYLVMSIFWAIIYV